MTRESRLEAEQADLLIALVESYRFRREPFLVLEAFNALGHVFVRHPGLKEDLGVPPHDLKVLEREGFLFVTERGRGVQFFIPTPEARELYRQTKTQARESVEHVETEVRLLFSAEAMRNYPRACEAWQKAESLYWQLDAADHLSEIGHHCREAIQAFASELASKHGITDIDPDPTKTINRVTAVLRDKTGATVAGFLDTLIDYWRKVNDLVQRQVHRGQKEGRPIDLEDARLVVFQTLIVMYEVHRAASRA